MHLGQPHTRSLIRILRTIGPLRARRGRMPRQQQPDAIRLGYFNAIRSVCDQAEHAFSHVRGDVLRELADHVGVRPAPLAIVPRQDAPGGGGATIGGGRAIGAGQRARALVERAAERFAGAFEPRAVHDVARRFGRQTSDFQRAQLDRQVRAAVGVPLAAIERPILERIDGWAAENVALIRTVPERYFDRLRLDVTDAFEAGTAPEVLAGEFADRYEISLNDARRVARDQVGKLSSQVNQARQESLGVTGYIWRTVRDNRVRDEHAEREGEHFEWDDPPEDGHAGIPPLCRCYAEPRLSELIDE